MTSKPIKGGPIREEEKQSFSFVSRYDAIKWSVSSFSLDGVAPDEMDTLLSLNRNGGVRERERREEERREKRERATGVVLLFR